MRFLGSVLALSFLIFGVMPDWTEAYYREDSFIYMRSQGKVDLLPYLDRSRIYLAVNDPTVVGVVLKEMGLKKERDVGLEGREVLARVLHPRDVKKHVAMLNFLNQDTRIAFVSPVFSFQGSSELSFSSLMGITNVVSLRLKPGVSKDDLKEAFGRIGIDEKSINEVGVSGAVNVAVAKNSKYDAFLVAAFFSPYFDPRIAESTLSWVRLEVSAEAVVRMYPEKLYRSSAGFIVIEPVVIEVVVKTLSDIEFRPQEISSATSLMRGWQPDSQDSRKVLGFFDEELAVVKEPDERFTKWTVKLRGYFLRWGDFTFPSLRLPIRPRLESGETSVSISYVETNTFQARVSELSPPSAVDLISVSAGKMPLETWWRSYLMGGGAFFTLLALGAAAVTARSWLKKLFSPVHKESTLDEEITAVISRLDVAYKSLLSQPEVMNEERSSKDWFAKLYLVLGELADILRKRSLRDCLDILDGARKRLEYAQFSSSWSSELRDTTHVVIIEAVREVKRREGGKS